MEFLQFLLATPLHWIYNKFDLFICLSVFLRRIWCTILHYLGLYFCAWVFIASSLTLSITYPIILTLKIHQSVVLKVVQLFPMSSWFPSSLWLKSVSNLAHPVSRIFLSHLMHWNYNYKKLKQKYLLPAV